MTRLIRAVLPIAFLAAACSGEEPVELPGTSSVQNPAVWSYERELTFLTAGSEPLMAVPFAFRTTPIGGAHERANRAWLARGETWDRFVDDVWSGGTAAGVWRVLPSGDLKIGATAAENIDWLAYSSGDRRLRVDVEDTSAIWYGADRERFRWQPAVLTLGDEGIAGYAVEEMMVTRARPEAGLLSEDRLILLDASGIALYLFHQRQQPDHSVWALVGDTTAATGSASIDWIQVRTVDEARRDIPLHWSFQVDDPLVSGEVTAIGYDVVFGEPRGGRRDVEVRYTVEGWIERDGEREEVLGVARHVQR